jgi:hypothetical protein
VFAYACRENRITLTDVRAVGGVSIAAAHGVVEYLVAQKLLEPLDGKNVYTLASHLRERYLTTLSKKKTASAQTEKSAEEDTAPSRHQVGTKSGPS